MEIKNSPRGRSVSSKKLLHRDRTGLSTITMNIVRDGMETDDLEYERVRMRVSETQSKLHSAHSDMKKKGIRTGILDKGPDSNRPFDRRNLDEMTSTKMKAILEEELRVVDDNSEGREEAPVESEERVLFRDSEEQIIRISTIRRLEPYSDGEMGSLHESPLLRSVVLNGPSNYKEHKIRQKILHNK